MRAALPQLEKEANKWEVKSKDNQRISNKNQKSHMLFPSVVLKPASEIEEQIGLVLDERHRVKTFMSHDIALKKKEKVDVCSEIAALRRRLSVLNEEKAPLQMAQFRLKAALQLEQGRLSAIRREHLEIRDMFSRRNKAGQEEYSWVNEAYLSVAGEKF